jgi:hypoxanthine phosphoribosyltransferase
MNVLITTEDIQQRVRDMAVDIARDHPNGVHLVAVLKGAFVFLSDLARVMAVPCSLDFMALSSYGKSTSSSGQVQLLKDLDSGLEGRDVVIVEDIVDTGLTLTYLQEILRARSPRSLRTACLLSKPSRRKTEVKVEYVRAVPQPAIHRCAGEYGARASGGQLTAARTFSAHARASLNTDASSSVSIFRSLISTLPWTMEVRTSSPRVV